MDQPRKTSSKTSADGPVLFVMLIVIVGVATAATFRQWYPPVASEHGGGIDSMINYLLAATGVLFIVGHLALGYFVWRFSRQERATFRLASPAAERAWSLIPVILMAVIAEGGVFVLGLPVWGKLYATSAPETALTVEITGEQFGWNIRYPGRDGVFGRTDPKLIAADNKIGLDPADRAAADDIVLLGELALPVNRPVRLRLRSKDTLHSLFLPHHRIKQDLVPGMTIEIWFVPTQTGAYEIACAELCGLGHYQMRGALSVVEPAEFERWLADLPSFSRSQ